MGEETIETVGPIITSAHNGALPLKVIVVGAGGTGGRVIPPLMQILRRGDSVAIVDGDHVEDRNLARQNFRLRDIGENKAEVMARRYRRDGIQIDAFASMLTDSTWADIYFAAEPTRVIILGCVDNPEARRMMWKTVAAKPRNGAIWIDGGNERRGGQVIMSAGGWPFKINYPVRGEQYQGTHHSHLNGMSAMPQLLQFQPWHCHQCDVSNKAGATLCHKCHQPEASCRDRIDIQTVAVNQMSATCMINVLTCVLYGIPMMTCGVFFSTLNTMSPIMLKSVNWDSKEIFPEVTYATSV